MKQIVLTKIVDLWKFKKTGYITGNRVARTDIHNGRVQNAYYTFCFKAFAGERLPDGLRANGFNERIIPLHCYDGIPKYDISEIVSPAGEQEYQEELDRIEYTHNLLLVHRMIHYFEPIQQVKTGLKSREKQLFSSLMRIFHNTDTWPELKSVISHYISERRKRQLDTLPAYLYGLIKRLIIAHGSFDLKSSDVWTEIKTELDGKDINNKPLSYDTERFGTISHKEITKILIDIFGAQKPKSHGSTNRLVFSNEKLGRLGTTYEIDIDAKADCGIEGIDGIDGDDIKCGMDEYVENDHGTATTVQESEVNTQNIGIVGDDGIDIIDKDVHYGDGDYTDDSKDLDSDISITDLSSMDHHNSNSHVSESNQSLSISNSQIRRAASTAAFATATTTTNLSHVSQVSQPTMEAITQFFYDEPYLPYQPPPPHKLEDSPCKSIIRIDNHSLFYCTLHPDVQSYHLESIEHHMKYKDPEVHKSEILKQLIAYVSEDELES